MLYEVLHTVVKELRPLSEAYYKRLGYFHKKQAHAFTAEWLRELADMKLELADLSRSIRPLRQVVHHVIEDEQIGRNSKMYLEDVEDAVNEMIADMDQLGNMASSLMDAHQRFRDTRMNDTLFALSLLSAIFLPASFITGLYGMNFVRPDGTPSMPELRWTNGYKFFWFLQFVSLVSCAIVIAAIVGGLPTILNQALFSCHRRRPVVAKLPQFSKSMTEEEEEDGL